MKSIIIVGLSLTLCSTIMLMGYLCYKVEKIKIDAYKKGYYDSRYDMIKQKHGEISCGQYWKYQYEETSKMLNKRLSRTAK